MNYITYKLADIVINQNDLPNIPKGTPESAMSAGLKIVFGVAASISVLIIVLAGLRMVTSVGNPEAVNKARNTVVFASIGLAVCLSGFIIVAFVLQHI